MISIACNAYARVKVWVNTITQIKMLYFRFCYKIRPFVLLFRVMYTCKCVMCVFISSVLQSTAIIHVIKCSFLDYFDDYVADAADTAVVLCCIVLLTVVLVAAVMVASLFFLLLYCSSLAFSVKSILCHYGGVSDSII